MENVTVGNASQGKIIGETLYNNINYNIYRALNMDVCKRYNQIERTDGF